MSFEAGGRTDKAGNRFESGNEIKCEDNKNSIVKENLIVGEDENQQSSYEVSQNYLQPMCEPRRVCRVDG